ncbi:hypothetical protein C8F01DRAFT_1236948 [Mycena amicta]|nr:hypothetical protein C8F01DRAFT_1236948 [Mycena amicta]
MFSVLAFQDAATAVESQPRRRYETHPPWSSKEPQKPHRVLCTACASQSGLPMARYDYSRAGTCVACGRRFLSAAAAQAAGYASAIPVLVPGPNPSPYSAPSTPSYANQIPNHPIPVYHSPAQGHPSHASYSHPPASRGDVTVVAPPGFSHRALHPAPGFRLPPTSPWAQRPLPGPTYYPPPVPQQRPRAVNQLPASEPPKTPPRAVTPDWARTTPSPSPSPVSSPIGDDPCSPLRLPTPPPRFAVAVTRPLSLAPPTSRAPARAASTKPQTNFRWASLYRPPALPPSPSPVNASAALDRVHQRTQTAASTRTVNHSAASAVRIPPTTRTPPQQVLGKRPFPFDLPEQRHDQHRKPAAPRRWIHLTPGTGSSTIPASASTAVPAPSSTSSPNILLRWVMDQDRRSRAAQHSPSNRIPLRLRQHNSSHPPAPAPAPADEPSRKKARVEVTRILSAPAGKENRRPSPNPYTQNSKSGKPEVREGVKINMRSRSDAPRRTMRDMEDLDSISDSD